MENKRPPFPPRFPRSGPPNQQPPKPPESDSQAASLGGSDVINVTGKLGPGRKEPPPVISTKLGDDTMFGPGGYNVVSLEDGTEIVKYAKPQKLSKLLKDAKAHLGGESSRFFGKGWVIGEGVAKIAPDGTSITYYPTEIAELVRDLLGPDSETI